MPQYYVQNFTYDGPGDSRCYGEMEGHNHAIANQFTVDVTAYLVNQGLLNIHAGNFLSNQPRPVPGKEFRWDSRVRRWIKV